MNADVIVSNWQRNSEAWKLDANNDLQMSVNQSSYLYIVSDASYQNFFLESTFRMTGDDDGIGFAFDFKDEQNYKQLIYEGGGLGYGVNKVKIFQVTDGTRTHLYDNSSINAWSRNEDVKLSIEIVYNKLHFRLNGELIFTYELSSYHDGSVGFLAYSQVYIAKDITLERVLANKMTGSYKLIGSSYHEIDAGITVRVPNELETDAEIHIRAYEEYEMPTEIDVKYRGNSEVLAEIQPVGHMNIPAEITVRSGNRMWALYEVQEPPKITSSFDPYKDSMTRGKPEFEAINYGGHNSLAVGYLDDDVYNSFIQFGLVDWNPQFKIIESKLRLYYSGAIPDGAKFELYTVDDIWFEYGITHLNKPEPFYLVVDEYDINPTERYVEFNVTETLLKWMDREEENNGIMIRLADDSMRTHVTFRSRESARPPELIVTYYDGRVYSAGRSQTLAEIFVWRVGESEVLAEIEVHSVIGNSDVPTEIYVHRYEVPVPHDIDAEITVTREIVDSELTVSLQDDSEVLAEISSRVAGNPSRRDAEITISKPIQLAEIFVAYINEVDTELTVQRHEDNDITTEITVTREHVDTEIYVKHREDLETEIEVQRHEDSTRDVEITVTRESTHVEITPRAIGESITDTEITIRLPKTNEIPTEITVTREHVHTEITARQVEVDNIETEIYARAIRDSELDTEIAVTREFVDVEITVSHYNDTEAEIYVKHRDYIETEITVTVFDDILAEIDIVATSKTESEITISRPNVPAEITVPFWDDSDVFAEILPRILRASDVDTEIVVRGLKKGAYAFII